MEVVALTLHAPHEGSEVLAYFEGYPTEMQLIKVCSEHGFKQMGYHHVRIDVLHQKGSYKSSEHSFTLDPITIIPRHK